MLRCEGVAINGDEEVLPDGILDVERGREGRRDRAQVLVLLAQALGKRELEVRFFTGRLKDHSHHEEENLKKPKRICGTYPVAKMNVQCCGCELLDCIRFRLVGNRQLFTAVDIVAAVQVERAVEE